ncbi:MAG TPA: tetratricopeptide repeat protein, partial [Firmicutes bacterium]|nr:tetratricopeptide repeat protein [Bacillota bacterium]
MFKKLFLLFVVVIIPVFLSAQEEFQPSYEDLIYDAEDAFYREDYATAIELFNKALTLEQGSASVWEMLGDSYVELGSLTLAGDAYKNAIKRGDATLELWRKYAQTIAKIGSEKDRVEAYKGWANADPNDPEPHLALLEIYKAVGDEKGIQRELEALLGIGVENYDYYIELADIYEKKRDVERAMKQYRFAIDIDPTRYEAHLRLGDILWSKGNLQEALYEFEDIVRYNPELPYGHYGLGIISYELGDDRTAISELEIVLNSSEEGRYRDELGDRYFKALKVLTELYHRVGMYDEVVELAGRARGMGYNDDDVFYLAGNGLMNLGKTDEAEDFLKEAISLNYKNAMAHYDLGRIYFERADFSSSVIELESAVKYNDKLYGAYLLLGYAYSNLNDSDSAYMNFKRARELRGGEFEPHFEIAKILISWGRYKDALVCLEQAKK